MANGNGKHEGTEEGVTIIASRDDVLRRLCRKHAPEAVRVALQIMRDRTKPPASRLSAATIILDRGYGKAPQALQLQNADGESIPIRTIEVVLDALPRSLRELGAGDILPEREALRGEPPAIEAECKVVEDG